VEAALAIIFVLLIVAGGAYYFNARSRQRREAVGGGPERSALGSGGARAGSTPSQELSSDIRRLKVGDVVNHEGRDYLVEGTITFNEDGFEWKEHLLQDADAKVWISVEDEEGLEVALWQRVAGATLAPGPETIDFEGTTYRLDEQGRAQYRAEGSTGTGEAGRMEYADYEAGDRRLSFERYSEDGTWEAGLGQVISEHVLDIYPAREGSR
jgi:hypothetical protein